MLELCPFTGRVLRFLEKPSEGETSSRKASVVFYCLRAQTVRLVEKYLCRSPDASSRSMGLFVRWLVEEEQGTVFGMKLPTGFALIGHRTTLRDYERCLARFREEEEKRRRREAGGGAGRDNRIVRRAYARVGVTSNCIKLMT